MRRRRLFYICTISAIFGSIVHVACSSDDGAEHGPSFNGDDSGVGSDGKISSSDGSPIDDDGSVSDDGSIPTCTTGTIAVIGGSASGSFGAYVNGGGGFASVALPTSMAALPAVVSFGTGFQAVFHAGGSNALFSTAFAGAGWSAPAAISGTLVREAPALAVSGSTLHLLYQANDDAGADEFKYFHGSYASSWTVGDPVGTGVDQSNGPHAIGAAGLASELVTGQVGGNDDIYARSWNGSWQSSVDIAADAGSNREDLGAAAHVVALTGGSSELLLVYTRRDDYKIMSLTRAGGTWAASPTLASTDAFTTEPFQLAPLAGGKAVVAWRGSDSHGYVSVFDGTNWSTPYAVAPFSIESAPAVAVGNCGSAAVAVYAKTGGNVEMVRFDGTTWSSSPAVVTKLASYTYVAVAVSP